MLRNLSRRSFLRESAKSLSGFATAALFSGLPRVPNRKVDKRMDSDVKRDSESATILPRLEIAGSNYEIGTAIGKRFRKNTLLGLKRRKKWFGELKAAANGDFRKEYEACVAAARKHFAHYVEEIRGWADAAGVPFDDLMVINMWAELTAMRRSRAEGACSTISLNDGERIILAHNEDGSAAYEDLMFWLEAHPDGGRSFRCLCYPGFIPGNSPGFNDAGIVQTTNYIPCSEWKVGIPRYILDRAILDAKSLDEAVKIATHPERAYGNHHNLASTKERRILSVETTATKHEVHEVHGVYFHTNHLSLPSMKDLPQFPGESSLSRHKVLTKETAGWQDAFSVRVSDIVLALCSHEGKPNSVCRHAEHDTDAVTLGTAVFEIPKATFRLYRNNPCLGSFIEGRL